MSVQWWPLTLIFIPSKNPVFHFDIFRFTMPVTRTVALERERHRNLSISSGQITLLPPLHKLQACYKLLVHFGGQIVQKSQVLKKQCENNATLFAFN